MKYILAIDVKGCRQTTRVSSTTSFSPSIYLFILIPFSPCELRHHIPSSPTSSSSWLLYIAFPFHDAFQILLLLSCPTKRWQQREDRALAVGLWKLLSIQVPSSMEIYWIQLYQEPLQFVVRIRRNNSWNCYNLVHREQRLLATNSKSLSRSIKLSGSSAAYHLHFVCT